MPVRTRSQTTKALAIKTTPARSRPHRNGTTRAEAYLTPPPAPVKKVLIDNKSPISPVQFSKEIIQEISPSRHLALEISRTRYNANHPSDHGTPLLGEIRKRSIEELTTYFTQLFHLRVFNPVIDDDDCLEMELTDVSHSSMVSISRNTLKQRLKTCGFRFSLSAIALYLRVLDPCCILIGSEDGFMDFTIDKAVRAMVYCVEMELFGLQTDRVYNATKKEGQKIIETVPICFV
jgi:hypothetical protein